MVDLRFWKLCVGLEKLDTKSKTDDQQESINDQESLKVDESCKKGVTEDKAEEDVCPICLEGCVSLDHCKIYLIRLIGCFFSRTRRRVAYLILKREENGPFMDPYKQTPLELSY